MGLVIKKNMKKTFLTILIFLFIFASFPLITFADWCSVAGGSWQTLPGGDTCVCPDGYAASGGSCTDNCPTGKTYDAATEECVTVQTTNTIYGPSSIATEAEASRCTSAWCYPTTDIDENGTQYVGVNKQATYDYSTGLCSCPSGYSSTTVEYFNSSVTDPNFNASSGVSGTSSSTTSGSSSSTTSNTYTSGNSGGGSSTFPTVTSTGILTNPITSGSFADLLNRIIDWILNIALVLAPLVIVYGGFIYMTAAGDTGKVTQGKNIVLYAVIGFIVALLAKSLIGIFTDLVVK